ncbi:hypothetical protein AAMO2058_000074300 [Amorphochlora amoebiformis]|mmetsp:Transcript_8492/g.13316  ORF Transcript_8492/g.13316 Transcript_8492/m.13316 type:complete len:162 (-) Transcript_8492:382-867(-)
MSSGSESKGDGSSLPGLSMLRASPPNSSGLQLPTLVRSSSSGRPQFGGEDWRINVAIEERTAVREKITSAYHKSCASYEELLRMCVAIEEELIFSGCKSRMEYFKNAVQWNNRLQIKKKQLSGAVMLGTSNGNAMSKRPLPPPGRSSNSLANPPPAKRDRK